MSDLIKTAERKRCLEMKRINRFPVAFEEHNTFLNVWRWISTHVMKHDTVFSKKSKIISENSTSLIYA